MYQERTCLDHSMVVVLLVMDHKLRHCGLTLMSLQTVDLYTSGCWALG